jgi:hypothetical protein
MRHSRVFGLLLLGSALATGCADDETAGLGTSTAGDGDGDGSGDGDGDGDGNGDGDGDGDGNGDGDGDGDGAGDGDGDGDGTGDGDGDGDGDPNPEPPDGWEPFDDGDWARGNISIKSVHVNQGVSVEIANANGPIDPEERWAGLVSNRRALIQALWQVPNGWEARPITAKLQLLRSNGTVEVLETTKTVSGTSSEGSGSNAFEWVIDGPDFDPWMHYYIELWEGEGGHENIGASGLPPAMPSDGFEWMGATDEAMEYKVIFVPVVYDYGGNCTESTVAQLNDEAFLLNFLNNYWVHNPVHDIEYSVRQEPIYQTTQVTSLSQINNKLVQMRFEDHAEPNVYYHALLDACSGGIDGASGVSPGTPPPTKGAGDSRVSVTLWGGSWSWDTYVHETGHNQGRAHSPCHPQVDRNPDDTYPYENGSIGAWGWNINSGSFYSPNSFVDYMSYCNPVWVSDWTWGWIHTQVKTLSSWDYESPEDELDWAHANSELLAGYVYPDGSESWWTGKGYLIEDQLTPGEAVEFYDDDGYQVAVQPASVAQLKDGSLYVMAEVPEHFEDITDMIRVSPGVRAPISTESLPRYIDSE